MAKFAHHSTLLLQKMEKVKTQKLKLTEKLKNNLCMSSNCVLQQF